MIKFVSTALPTGPRFIDLTGKRFGRLLVIRFAGVSKSGQTFWHCQCKCEPGKGVVARSDSLKDGNTSSCGCVQAKSRRNNGKLTGPANGRLNGPKRRTHGESAATGNSAEYQSWRAMRDRCYRTKNIAFKNYGARGITVCDRWRDSFENFLQDMGRRPTLEHTLDRYPDKNGNYEPGNCRWATVPQQLENRRKQKKRVKGEPTS